jgi:hypothetical protein
MSRSTHPLARVLDPKRLTSAAALRAATRAVRELQASLSGPYAGSMLVPPLLSRKVPARKNVALWAKNGAALMDAVFELVTQKGWEALLGETVKIDAEDAELAALFARVAGDRAAKRRTSDALRFAAQTCRSDAATMRRIEVARAALRARPQKKRAPIVRDGGVGTDGGPVLALPREALASWGGTLPSSRPIKACFRFGDPDAPATDYDRACDVDGVGLLRVGVLRGLVLAHTGCDFARLADGSFLLVLDGLDDDLAAAPEAKTWRKLAGPLELPSGELVIFEASAAAAKTRNKARVKLPSGSYAVEELRRNARSLWVVRLKKRRQMT